MQSKRQPKVHTYSKKRRRKVQPARAILSVGFTFLVAGVIGVVGYSIAKPILEYSGAPRVTEQAEGTLPAATAAATAEISTEAETLPAVATSTPAVAEESLSEGYQLSAAALENSSTLSAAMQTARNAVPAGKLLVIPLKIAGGELCYQTDVALAKSCGAAKGSLQLSEIAEAAKAQGWTPVAQLSLLRDNLLPDADAEAGYMVTSGGRWLDNTKENGGKADALNMGINAAQYPYFICIDADSVLQYDSLREIVAPVIEHENVVAVGGLVRLSNGIKIKDGRLTHYSLPKKIIPAMQVLEYDRSFLSARILFDQFNGNLIISGAFGMFRKDYVVACGGYDRDTVGEDMELVTKLHVFCRTNGEDYLIKYAPDAICWSQAPDNLRDLVKQRRRWHTGLFESMTKHWRIFANLRFGLVSFFSYTYFLIYELLSPLIELFGLVTIAIAVAFDFINVPFMIMFFVIYAVFGAVMSLTAFFSRVQTRDLKLSAGDVARALLLSIFEVTVLRFILAITRMIALVGYRRKERRWEKVERQKIDAEN